jgi:hypothetical protein
MVKDAMIPARASASAAARHGGRQQFIGAVHRIARLNGRYELVAGALSATPEKRSAPVRRSASRGSRLCRFQRHGQARAPAERRHRGGRDVTPNHMLRRQTS